MPVAAGCDVVISERTLPYADVKSKQARNRDMECVLAYTVVAMYVRETLVQERGSWTTVERGTAFQHLI